MKGGEGYFSPDPAREGEEKGEGKHRCALTFGIDGEEKRKKRRKRVTKKGEKKKETSPTPIP